MKEPQSWLSPRRGDLVALSVVACALAAIATAEGSVGACLRVLAGDLVLVPYLVAAIGWGVLIVRLAGIAGSLATMTVTAIALGLGFLGFCGLAGGVTTLASVFGGVALSAVWALSGHPAKRVITWLSGRTSAMGYLCLPAAALVGVALVGSTLPPGLLWQGYDPHPYDVLSYHLQIPREWWESGRCAPLPHNVFSYMPLGTELHFLNLMRLGGGPWQAMYACQAFTLVMSLLAGIGLWSLARDMGLRVPALAAALMLATPWVAMLSGVAYGEALMLLLIVAALPWVIRVARGSGVRDALVAGILVGMACGAKITVVAWMPLGIGAAWLVLRRERALLPLAVGLAGLVASISPWLIRDWMATGNPVFPIASQALGRGHFSETQATRFTLAHQPTPNQRSLEQRAKALVSQVVTDERFGFALIPLGILGLAMALRDPRRQAAAICLVMLAVSLVSFWLFFTHLQGRFAVGLVPLFALGAVLGLDRRWKWTLGLVVAGLPLLLLSNTFALGGRGYAETIGSWAAQDSVVGLGDLSRILPDGTRQLLVTDKTLVLTGEARAFLFPVSMRRLRYTGAFDWVSEPNPGPGEVRIINWSEVRRLQESYHAMPQVTIRPGDHVMDGSP